MDFLPQGPLSSVLRRLGDSLARGALWPLPTQAHPLGSARAALRAMSQARHVGKVVVRVRSPAVAALEGGPPAALITGGTGALGGLVGLFLARGASTSHIVLAARTGRWAPSKASQACTNRGRKCERTLPWAPPVLMTLPAQTEK